MTKRPLLLALTCSSLLACTSVSTLGTGTDSEEGGSSGSGDDSGQSSTGGSLNLGGAAMSSTGGAPSAGGEGSGKGGASSSAGTSSSAGEPATTAGTTGVESGGEPATGGTSAGMSSTGGGESLGGTNSMGGTGGQPTCISTLEPSQGNDPPDPEDCAAIGETLKQEHDTALLAPELDVAPLAGTWIAGSGTSRVEVVIDAQGKGIVRFGEPSEFPEFEEGDESFLTGTDADDANEVLDLSHLRPQAGFGYSILADAGRGSEMSFHVLVLEAWDEWCAAQAPVASPDARSCYACMHDEGIYTFATCDGEPNGCFAGNQDLDEERRVDCGRVELCLMPYHNACNCNADGCFANLGTRNQLTEYPFSLELDPVDTTVLRLQSHSELVDKVTHYLKKQE